ncbi:S8 family serine peptidase, partial [bacterium]|nr:S8 family serine peptidase [bacterium]
SILIAAGQTSATVLFVPIDDATDPVYEEAENVVISVSNVNGGLATENGIQSETITITENEAVPTLSLSGAASIDEKTQTATVTANLSIKTDKTVTVSFSNSGTSTANTDYTLSNITIGAGATSGSQPLTPVEDTDFEGGSETVKLTGSASGISGISNSNEIIITITNKALNSGTQKTYDTSLAAVRPYTTEYNWIQNGSSNTYDLNSPYNNMNLHMALAYGEYGSGLRAAVLDTGFWLTEAGKSSDHLDLDNKSISAFGAFNAAGTNCLDSHGTCVLGALAADLDAQGMMGVAPDVALHISDWKNTTGYTDQYAKMAAATNDATSTTTVVQNNSWGASGFDANNFQAYVDTYGDSESTILAIWGALAGGGTTSTVTEYYNALKSFQQNGVIVFANGNDNTKSSAAYGSSMPIWLDDLAERWITVANVDVGGVAGSQTYTNIGNPCGLAAKFCMAADGHRVALPTYQSGSTGYYQLSTGTSFSAPFVSGAVVLMAAHFPNQTPDQWVDRLLASANNDIGFTHVGHVEFGSGGVKHSYSNEAGHGMLDIYAALQPIVSDSYTPLVAAGGKGPVIVAMYEMNETAILSASSFGDSLANALGGEFTYMYDALDGGFAFDLEQTVKPSLSVSKPVISIDRELGLTRSVSEEKLAFSNSFSKVLEQPGYLNYSRNESNGSLTSFTSNGLWNGFSDASYVFPFLTAVQGGTGLNYGDSLGNGFLSLSYNSENDNGSSGNPKNAYSFSYRLNLAENTNLNYVGGIVNEGESFLGSAGGGAFDFSGSENVTSFFGIKSGIKLADDYFLNVGYGLS